MFNIGAEGQYIVAAVASTIVGYLFNLPAILQVPLVVMTGMVTGALYGGIVGFLKAKFGIHEVLTSIMLNWLALYLSNFVVQSDAFHQPNTTATYPVNPSSYTMLLPEWKTSDEGIAFLKMCIRDRGKDTTIVHWEIAGIASPKPLPTYPDGFPKELLDAFSSQTGRKVLCNKPVSYTHLDVYKRQGHEWKPDRSGW